MSRVNSICLFSAVWLGSASGVLAEPLAWAEFWEVIWLKRYNTSLVVLATSLLGLASGVVGSFLLLRKRSLLGDALSHATLPGICVAFAVMVAAGGSGKWLPGLLCGAAISGIVGVLVMLAIRNSTQLSDDVAMGLVLSVFFGLGVALMGIVQTMPGASAAGLEKFIYGKTASIVMADLRMIACIAGLVLVICFLCFKEFSILCFDENFARTQGFPAQILDLTLLGLVTAVTVVGLQSVGLILIIAFLITPPAAARFWTESLPMTVVLAGLIGAASGWLGASFSAWMPDLPAGAVIVIVAAGIFACSMIFAPCRGLLSRFLRHRRLARRITRQHLLRAVYEILESRHPAVHGVMPPNERIRFRELVDKRSWSESELRRILRREVRSGHVQLLGNTQLCLTEEGFGEAARITRNHRLWEIYLVTHAEIAPSHVDRDADTIEHILEAGLVRQLEEELRLR
ncbi:MAG: iron chelate uptake ABC transporter family permease subunit, partial [Luteolibacter sp.]